MSLTVVRSAWCAAVENSTRLIVAMLLAQVTVKVLALLGISSLTNTQCRMHSVQVQPLGTAARKRAWQALTR